ncbi:MULTISPECIES: type II toxin-antitoxin system Phd/YefM family antitoxin [Pseudanabaena]|uniref:type II toxin-antitoxin system Phd/YefM family antitoxin n=1 Tax=Pseudanabaena TaxID=1152 RepID=UPI002479D091|nr:MULTISPECIES: type II toxin-antitoxin system prevent-host-death family antitoxin [Pseudanabaena]MEA5488573.1 type II toxin-antitoxin system prevent-host-death family antitoxin [Pseudanabaena sp. CCNP1317]WGS71973.1 type II toxin-antitoxin system prevent-host-death family antitoxin [Pseudanabaena galeata CCNP1313]
MNVISYVDAQRNLAKMIDQVCDRHDPLIITRHQQPSAVLLSLEDYESLTETAYLLKSRNNAKRIFEAIAELESGGVTVRELIE